MKIEMKILQWFEQQRINNNPLYRPLAVYISKLNIFKKLEVEKNLLEKCCLFFVKKIN